MSLLVREKLRLTADEGRDAPHNRTHHRQECIFRSGVKRAAGGVRLIHTFVRQINSGKERKWVYAIWNSLAFGPKSLSDMVGTSTNNTVQLSLYVILAIWRNVERWGQGMHLVCSSEFGVWISIQGTWDNERFQVPYLLVTHNNTRIL